MDKNLCTIYIVRHGETKWNIEKRLQGQEDSPLTPNGESQAKELGKVFKNIHFDAVFSSDLLRAKRTAEIITLEKKLEVITAKLIRERSLGKFEGKKYEELRKFEDAFNKLTEEEKHSSKLHPEIESDKEISTRFITFLRDVGVGFTGKTILVVAHGAIIRAFLIRIGFANYQSLRWGSVENTAYVKLQTDGTGFFVKKTKGIRLLS